MMFGCAHEEAWLRGCWGKRVPVDGCWRGDLVLGGVGVVSRTVVFVETGAEVGAS